MRDETAGELPAEAAQAAEGASVEPEMDYTATAGPYGKISAQIPVTMFNLDEQGLIHIGPDDMRLLQMSYNASVEDLQWWLGRLYEHAQPTLSLSLRLRPEAVRQLIEIMMPVKPGRDSMPMNDAISYAIIHMGSRLNAARSVDQWLQEETS